MDTEAKPLWVTTREAMGKTWSIELWPDFGPMTEEGNDGTANSSFLRIRVNACRPPSGRDETTLHEIVHIVNDDLALKLDEPTVSRLSQGLYAFLRGFGLWCEFPWPDGRGPTAEVGERPWTAPIGD